MYPSADAVDTGREMWYTDGAKYDSGIAVYE